MPAVLLSGAFNESRRLALGRLSQEARLAGADAVVGVRIVQGAHDWAAGAIQFIVVGTAVRLAPEMRNPEREAVLTDLTGQQFVQLCRAGVRPVGNCDRALNADVSSRHVSFVELLAELTPGTGD